MAYARLLHERRRALHAQALAAIERLYADASRDHVEALAHHALGGEVWDKAVDYLREAGASRSGPPRSGRPSARYEQALSSRR